MTLELDFEWLARPRFDPSLPDELFAALEECERIFDALSAAYFPWDERGESKMVRSLASPCFWIALDPVEAHMMYCQALARGHFAPVEVKDAGEDVGKGLFATAALRRHEPIGEFSGVVRRIPSDEERLANPYVSEYPCRLDDRFPWQSFSGVFLDASREGNWIRFANHARPGNAHPVYLFSEGSWRSVLVALSDIKPGEQILFDYGRGYAWKRRPKRLSP